MFAVSIFFKTFEAGEDLLYLDARIISPAILTVLQQSIFAGDRYDRFLQSLAWGVVAPEPVEVVNLGLASVLDVFQALPQQIPANTTIDTPYPADLIITTQPYLLLQVMPIDTQHPIGNYSPQSFFSNRFELCYGVSAALAGALYPPIT
jgi:hypothetical protein